MAVLPIRQIGDPVLRKVCRQVSIDELAGDEMQRFIDDLIETMTHANGAGLAAPQVGYPLAIAAVQIKDNPRYPYKPNFPLTVFVNPTITHLSDTFESLNEGCLSVPNLRGMVDRCMHIRVQAMNREGEPIDFEVSGLTAGTFQHEFDHLVGNLFVDRVTDPRTLCTWENFEAHHRETFVAKAKELVARYGQ